MHIIQYGDCVFQNCIETHFQAALSCLFCFLAVSFGFVLGTNFLREFQNYRSCAIKKSLSSSFGARLGNSMCKVTSIYKNDTKHSEFSCGMCEDGYAMKSLPIEHKLAIFSRASSWCKILCLCFWEWVCVLCNSDRCFVSSIANYRSDIWLDLWFLLFSFDWTWLV